MGRIEWRINDVFEESLAPQIAELPNGCLAKPYQGYQNRGSLLWAARTHTSGRWSMCWNRCWKVLWAAHNKLSGNVLCYDMDARAFLTDWLASWGFYLPLEHKQRLWQSIMLGRLVWLVEATKSRKKVIYTNSCCCKLRCWVQWRYQPTLMILPEPACTTGPCCNLGATHIALSELRPLISRDDGVATRLLFESELMPYSREPYFTSALTVSYPWTEAERLTKYTLLDLHFELYLQGTCANVFHRNIQLGICRVMYCNQSLPSHTLNPYRIHCCLPKFPNNDDCSCSNLLHGS